MTEFTPITQLPQERRWRAQHYPAPVVVAIIERKLPNTENLPTPHFLLIKRKAKTYGDHWALVGGKWNFGETLVEAIEREVREETGLQARFTAVRGIVSERVAPTSQEMHGAHFLIFVCALTAPQGNASEQHEGEVRWFSPPEIQALHTQSTIIPSDFAMLASFALPQPSAAFVEAEMSAALNESSGHPVALLRFEQIWPR